MYILPLCWYLWIFIVRFNFYIKMLQLRPKMLWFVPKSRKYLGFWQQNCNFLVSNAIIFTITTRESMLSLTISALPIEISCNCTNLLIFMYMKEFSKKCRFFSCCIGFLRWWKMEWRLKMVNLGHALAFHEIFHSFHFWFLKKSCSSTAVLKSLQASSTLQKIIIFFVQT